MAKQGIRKRVARTRVAENVALLRPGIAKEKPMPSFIAVIARANLTPGFAHSYTSDRYDGGWYALMGTDREALIFRAMDKAEEFSTDAWSKYVVWIGTLTEKVIIPPKREYRVVKL